MLLARALGVATALFAIGCQGGGGSSDHDAGSGAQCEVGAPVRCTCAGGAAGTAPCVGGLVGRCDCSPTAGMDAGARLDGAMGGADGARTTDGAGSTEGGPSDGSPPRPGENRCHDCLHGTSDFHYTFDCRGRCSGSGDVVFSAAATAACNADRVRGTDEVYAGPFTSSSTPDEAYFGIREYAFGTLPVGLRGGESCLMPAPGQPLLSVRPDVLGDGRVRLTCPGPTPDEPPVEVESTIFSDPGSRSYWVCTECLSFDGTLTRLHLGGAFFATGTAHASVGGATYESECTVTGEFLLFDCASALSCTVPPAGTDGGVPGDGGPRGCTSPADCAADPSRPVCSASGECVQCETDDDCPTTIGPPGTACIPEAEFCRCTARHECRQCSSDLDCVGNIAGQPRCLLPGTVPPENEAVCGCYTDADCPNPDANTCVESFCF